MIEQCVNKRRLDYPAGTSLFPTKNTNTQTTLPHKSHKAENNYTDYFTKPIEKYTLKNLQYLKTVECSALPDQMNGQTEPEKTASLHQMNDQQM